MDPHFFIGEVDCLFPHKWDRSSWVLVLRIDRSLDTIKLSVDGYGGPNGNHVSVEGPLERPCASWSHVFEHAVTSLRDQLQIQLDDTL